MSLQNMKNQGSYTLAKLKDEVYKALGEYSRNGMELGELSFQRADLSHKMISALNSAMSRASVSLPTFVESFMPRFLSCECLYRNNKPFELKEDLEVPTLEGPAEGAEFALADLINTAMQSELTTVNEYNTLALNARAEGFDDIASVIDDLG